MTLPEARTGTPAPEPTPARSPGVLHFGARPAQPPSAAARFTPRGQGDAPRLSADVSRSPESARSARAALAAALRQAGHLPPRLRQALALACENERPICTVGRLASLSGCDRRTLWNQWRTAVGREAPVRLEDFLHWQLLLRATALKEPALAWADVADRLGVHPHTVARLARQLTGRTLRELSACTEAGIAAEFERGFLPHLLGAEPDTPFEAPARRAS
ncbi:MAG TPA: hypothetical protein VF746_15975 [Longimicrobium sp.]